MAYKNKENARRYYREYHLKNKERRLRQRKEFYLKNRERILKELRNEYIPHPRILKTDKEIKEKKRA